MLVDDCSLVRHLLACLLEESPEIEIVGEASDGRDGVDLTQRLLPDVVIMDVSMPVMNGTEATRVIHSELPTVQVIGLSMCEGDEQVAMKQTGAAQYLSKNGPSDAVVAAIHELCPI